jgi:hypothetical protein
MVGWFAAIFWVHIESKRGQRLNLSSELISAHLSEAEVS